jgi:hypothetical protein
LCSEGPGLESLPRERLSKIKFFVVFLNPSTLMSGIMSQPFSTSVPIHYSLSPKTV